MVANTNRAKIKGQPFQIFPVDSVIAPMTTGPIQEEALLTTPNRPKNKFSFPLGTSSANMVCCQAQMGAVKRPDQIFNTHNSRVVYYRRERVRVSVLVCMSVKKRERETITLIPKLSRLIPKQPQTGTTPVSATIINKLVFVLI